MLSCLFALLQEVANVAADKAGTGDAKETKK
jgi:hypothetical protein